MKRLSLSEALKNYWTKVDRRGPDECWPWLGAATDRGYGQCGAGGKCLATHVALAITGQPRPSEHHLALHSCDNPPCVNPAHLRWGFVIDNVADRKARGRCRPFGRNWPRGERHRNAKLTTDLVRYIRQSPATTLELAAELGVTNQCISRVRLRQTWQHVD